MDKQSEIIVSEPSSPRWGTLDHCFSELYLCNMDRKWAKLGQM